MTTPELDQRTRRTDTGVGRAGTGVGRAVTGHQVSPLLVAAAFLVLGVAVAVAVLTPAPWWAVVIGVVGPDLTFLAAIGQRPAAPGLMPLRVVPLYNAAHRPAVAVVCTLIAAAAASSTLFVVGLAWISHIVWDRSVGYRLRDRTGAIRPRPVR